MATLIATADGNLTGSTTFAAAETAVNALILVRGATSTFAAAASSATVPFNITNGKVIDAVLLWVKVTAASPTGTFKVDLQKSGVSQASVTVNKTDLPDSTNAVPVPVLFKLTSTATGDGATSWTVVVTTTGTGTITYNYFSTTNNFTKALRTTTTATPAAADDMYIVGELTGAGTKNTRTVTMNSTAATVYGNGAVNSITVNGGGIHISNWGTLTYGITAGTNYILRVAGDVIVYQYGALNIVSPQTSTTQVLEFQPVSADGDFGLRCLDNSVVTITGQPRTAGKLVTQCKLTADVASSATQTSASSFNGVTSSVYLEASGNSLTAAGFTDNTTNATHGANTLGPNVTNTTQTATVWLARGSGTNNRYVRVTLGNSSIQTSVTHGFYSDIDLQAGTAGTVTAVGTGTATSVSITPVGIGYLVKMTGKLASTSQGPNLLLSSCTAAGTTSYAGNTTQCFIFDHVAVVNTASISDTTFNVDTDTGWLAGDAICIASTTRTATECEIFPLNANAGASSFTSALYPFGSMLGSSYQLASTHHGTAPTQAEIGLITRNVKIRSTSPTLMSYVYCTALSTVTASWAEFHYVGMSTVNKRGIEIDCGAITNPKSFSYCSIHDCDNNGLYCTGGNTSLNLVFSNNVLWNSIGNFATMVGTINNTDWTFDSNLVMKCLIGVTLGDVGGSFSNNTVVGAAGSSSISVAESGAVNLGVFENNTAHSCTNSGMIISTNGLSGTIAGFRAWRCGTAGVSHVVGSTDNLFYTNLTLFGNAASAQGNFGLSAGGAVNIDGGVIAGDTSFASNYAFSIAGWESSNFNLRRVDMSGSGTGHVPHVIAEFYNLSTPLYSINGVCNDCALAAPATVVNKSAWSQTSSLSFQKISSGNHRTEMTYGQLRTDSVIYHTAGPSMKMTSNNASNRLESAPLAKGIQVAVSSGNTVTAKVWVRKDASYTGSQPRLVVRANAAIGITTDTVLATASDVGDGTASTFLDAVSVNNVALSNGNLTATHITSATNSGARSPHFQSTGKFYHEVTVTTTNGNGDVIGIIDTNTNYAQAVGGSSSNCSVIAKNGSYFSNGVSGGAVGAITSGTIIGVAVDLTARKTWWRKSGLAWMSAAVGTQDPVTGQGGATIPIGTGSFAPVVTFGGGGSAANDTMTLNFGVTAYVDAPPSGFGNWTVTAGGVGSATWIELSGTTVAATDDGIMEFIVDCDGASGFINADDWEFTTDGVTTSNDLSNWFNGLPASGTEGGAPVSGGGGAYFSAGFV